MIEINKVKNDLIGAHYFNSNNHGKGVIRKIEKINNTNNNIVTIEFGKKMFYS